jgi:hypothetical protein
MKPVAQVITIPITVLVSGRGREYCYSAHRGKDRCPGIRLDSSTDNLYCGIFHGMPVEGQQHTLEDVMLKTLTGIPAQRMSGYIVRLPACKARDR